MLCVTCVVCRVTWHCSLRSRTGVCSLQQHSEEAVPFSRMYWVKVVQGSELLARSLLGREMEKQIIICFIMGNHRKNSYACSSYGTG